MFVHKVVKPARYFVNRLLHTLCTMKQDEVPMTEAIHKTLIGFWFLSGNSMALPFICMPTFIVLN